MEGKLIKFSSKEEVMWTKKLDDRDMEILQDVLEAHHENLMDILKDCVVDEDTQFQYKDELVRIERMLGLIYMEVVVPVSNKVTVFPDSIPMNKLN